MKDFNIPDFASVEKCHSSNYGENLFYKNIIELSKLKPQPKFLPWVTFNGKWIDIEIGYDQSFEVVLCKYFLENVPECRKHHVILMNAI